MKGKKLTIHFWPSSGLGWGLTVSTIVPKASAHAWGGRTIGAAALVPKIPKLWIAKVPIWGGFEACDSFVDE